MSVLSHTHNLLASAVRRAFGGHLEENALGME